MLHFIGPLTNLRVGVGGLLLTIRLTIVSKEFPMQMEEESRSCVEIVGDTLDTYFKVRNSQRRIPDIVLIQFL